MREFDELQTGVGIETDLRIDKEHGTAPRVVERVVVDRDPGTTLESAGAQVGCDLTVPREIFLRVVKRRRADDPGADRFGKELSELVDRVAFPPVRSDDDLRIRKRPQSVLEGLQTASLELALRRLKPAKHSVEIEEEDHHAILPHRSEESCVPAGYTLGSRQHQCLYWFPTPASRRLSRSDNLLIVSYFLLPAPRYLLPLPASCYRLFNYGDAMFIS